MKRYLMGATATTATYPSKKPVLYAIDSPGRYAASCYFPVDGYVFKEDGSRFKYNTVSFKQWLTIIRDPINSYTVILTPLDEIVPYLLKGLKSVELSTDVIYHLTQILDYVKRHENRSPELDIIQKSIQVEALKLQTR